MHEYPTLNFLLEHARALELAIAGAPLVAAAVAVAMGATPLWLLAGGALGLVGYGLVRSYVELIRLVTDMLLPK